MVDRPIGVPAPELPDDRCSTSWRRRGWREEEEGKEKKEETHLQTGGCWTNPGGVGGDGDEEGEGEALAATARHRGTSKR